MVVGEFFSQYRTRFVFVNIYLLLVIEKFVCIMYNMCMIDTGGRIVQVSSREARAKWRDLLDAIQHGSPGIVIERYGKPVAVLVSYDNFDELKKGKGGEGVIKEPTAVYYPTSSPAFLQKMNFEIDKSIDLQTILQNLSADAKRMVVEFARLLQPATQATPPTVAMPAFNINQLTTILQEGYLGNALADSEALYDDV